MQAQVRAVSKRSSLLRAACCSIGLRPFAAETASRSQGTYDVPAGHLNSDLGNVACNISLNRRRDLTLRQDLHVSENGKKSTLADVFKGKLVAVFGVPDMGKVCTEKHLPGILADAQKLKKSGVQKIACAAVTSPDQLATWAEKAGDSNNELSLIADETGGFTRMLGIDLPATSPGAPCSQRYAALVDDGILLKLKVEAQLADVKNSTVDSIIETMREQKIIK